MATPRLTDMRSKGGRGAPIAAPSAPPISTTPISARFLLLHTWPGRVFLGSGILKLLVAALRAANVLSQVSQLLSSLATIGLVISLSYFVWRLVLLTKRRLLWRVRRKLILSYIFIGVIPALLIVGFALVGASGVSMNVSAYLFRDGYDEIVDRVRLISQAAATDIGRTPQSARDIVERAFGNLKQRYPSASVLFLPNAGRAEAAAQAGQWGHVKPPVDIPEWLRNRAESFTGAVAVLRGGGSEEAYLIVRGVSFARGEAGEPGLVVVDVPLDDEVLEDLRETTGVRGGAIWLTAGDSDGSIAVPIRTDSASADRGGLFRNSRTYVDCFVWQTGRVRRAEIALSYRLGEVYQKVASRAQPLAISGKGWESGVEGFLLVLGVVAVLFLIIQIAALVMGLALARSITSSIHELFQGTERVRQGDFGHRIDISTKDQLGELAASFNQMTGSIENLLQTAAEKKRLEEELRIARQIQMSLLPRGPLDVPGLGITALCVPAREVGGDYYDFFQLPGDRLGVLIADVSGKGTSAALYMAELKGVVLALSQRYESPRDLLIETNRILSENLDSRSFITMTYAVIDLGDARMTYCRAGHTPLIFLSANSGPRVRARVLTPSGMVLGLRIPGAAEKFDELLEEESVALQQDDVIVLYTDGITEAMNPSNELFGESRLGRIVEEHGHLDSGELRERILREVESFVSGADQHDDMTMILLKVEKVGAMAQIAV